MTRRAWRGLRHLAATAALAHLVYAAFFYTVQRQRLFPLADGTRRPSRTPLFAPARLAEPAVSFGRAPQHVPPAAAP